MKKIVLLTLLILATVLVTLAVTAAAAPKAPTPVFAAPAVPAAALPEERHPHIHAALESMRGAKHDLESAAHDFEGHRVESIKHLDMAIHEAEICEKMP